MTTQLHTKNRKISTSISREKFWPDEQKKRQPKNKKTEKQSNRQTVLHRTLISRVQKEHKTSNLQHTNTLYMSIR